MTVQEILATTRDWSILVLFVQWFILALLPAFLLWKVTRALKRFLPRARAAMVAARSTVDRVAQVISQCMAAVRRPFVWWSSAAHGAQTIVRRYQVKDL
jgi:hypothetical protein